MFLCFIFLPNEGHSVRVFLNVSIQAVLWKMSWRSQQTLTRASPFLTGHIEHPSQKPAYPSFVHVTVHDRVEVLDPAQPLTSEVVGLEGVLDAFGRLERGEAIKVLVQPNE